MKLEIVTPDGILFSGKVDSVTVPGKKGRFTVLEKHAPIISVLKKGKIIYKIDEESFSVQGMGGFIEVHNNIISIAIEVSE
jgi:F-type H+-transporting ATPase subunit epsilon